MRKKFVAGAAILALLMNAPQVSADDDIVIFGGEFEDEAAPSAKKKVEKKIETPEPKKPVEKPAPPPEIEKPQENFPTQPIEQPVEKPAPPPEVEKPQENLPTQPIEQPVEKPAPPPEIEKPQENLPTQPIEQPVEKPAPPPEIEKPQENLPTQPINFPTQPIEQPPVEIDRPFEQPIKISGGQEPIVKPMAEERSENRYFPSSNAAPPSTNLKTLKPRFIKLAVDDTYTYYLDKTSVQWKRMPYMANEYMADVWVRMVERNPSRLDNDMENYSAENFRAEVALAREQGYQYSPEDLKILRQQNYVLEHYYLRPKTKQIQFLCELEVFGRPQNAINERAYDYKNWENLVPGSIESAIYAATIKIIGKSKANERGHMTFADMLDEYARIALN